MVVYSKDKALMCKVFPSSLGLVAMRWFDSLRADSINSFKGLTWAFGFHFVTCSRVPRPLDSLLSLSMREGETLKRYSDRYWEMFNEIDGDFDDVAISTFKVGLPAEHGLRKSLIDKPVTSVRQLMDWIDKYKRVKEDQQQGKGRLRLSFKRGGILGRTDTIITNLVETLLSSQGLPTLRRLMLCSKNQCTKY